MLTLVRSIVSRFGCRFRSRAVVELENLALRHQLHVLRRQRPGRPRLFAIDRLLWVWLYRIWPRCQPRRRNCAGPPGPKRRAESAVAASPSFLIVVKTCDAQGNLNVTL